MNRNPTKLNPHFKGFIACSSHINFYDKRHNYQDKENQKLQFPQFSQS